MAIIGTVHNIMPYQLKAAQGKRLSRGHTATSCVTAH